MTVAESSEIAAPSRLGRQTTSLLANTGLNGVLGILFWLLAGRLGTTRDVALAIAVSSLVVLLSLMTQLNLSASLSRFIGVAGRGQRAMVAFCYRLAMGGCLAVAVAVILLAAVRNGELVRAADWGIVALLVVGVPLWTAFALQDNVLLAARRAAWIPVENATAAVLRLALLPMLAGAGAVGIFGAYLLPAVPAVALVSWLFLVRLPKGAPLPPPARRRIVWFAVAGLPGALATAAALRIVPVLILEFQGPDEAAFVILPWTVLTVALLALPALSLVLLAELSAPGADPGHVLYRSRRLLVLLVPVCALAALLAHPALSIAGPGYAENGSLLLISGVLALIPAAVTEAKIAVLRFGGRPGWATCVQVTRAALLLSAATVLALTDHLSLLGVAVVLAYGAGWTCSIVMVHWLTTRSGRTTMDMTTPAEAR